MKGLISDVFNWLSQTWIGWIAEHVTPWIEQVKALLSLGTPEPFKPGQKPQFIHPLLAPQPVPMTGPTASIGGGGTTVNAEIVVNGVPGMSEHSIGIEVADALRRMVDEAGSLGASAPRFAS